jgi:hypothetical protein
MRGAFLQALLHHAPLYALQKQIGHDPKPVIDSYTTSYILLFSQHKETAREVIEHTLVAADLMINASEADRQKLVRILKKRHQKTNKLVQAVINLQTKYNILIPDGNRKWGWSIIKELGLGSEWAEVTGEDVIIRIREHEVKP